MADLPLAPVAHADLHEVQAAEQLPVLLSLTKTVLLCVCLPLVLRLALDIKIKHFNCRQLSSISTLVN